MLTVEINTYCTHGLRLSSLIVVNLKFKKLILCGVRYFSKGTIKVRYFTHLPAWYFSAILCARMT